MTDLIVYGILGLLWLAVIILASRWSDDEGPADPPTDPDATIMLATIATWYQLNHDGRKTDQLLEHAATILTGAS